MDENKPLAALRRRARVDFSSPNVFGETKNAKTNVAHSLISPTGVLLAVKPQHANPKAKRSIATTKPKRSAKKSAKK